jgi:hypothetical protein
VPDTIYEVAEGGLTDGEPMIFLFGNPTRSHGKFPSVLLRLDAPPVAPGHHRQPHEPVHEQATDRGVDQDYGLDSDFVRVRVLGLPPSRQTCSSSECAGERGAAGGRSHAGG